MNTIKHINKNLISINKQFYKGYMLGDLPPTFSFLFKETIDEEENIVKTYYFLIHKEYINMGYSRFFLI